MRSDVESARRAALRTLAGAYATGALSTATLERRVDRALRATDGFELADCLWDVPRPAAWWRRRNGLRSTPPRALIVEDDDAVLRIALPAAPASLVIGRHPACDVRVANTSVSRRHAIIARRGGVCRIRDLGSSNGTLLNGAAIAVADIALGDHIALGELRVRVR